MLLLTHHLKIQRSEQIDQGKVAEFSPETKSEPSPEVKKKKRKPKKKKVRESAEVISVSEKPIKEAACMDVSVQSVQAFGDHAGFTINSDVCVSSSYL
jgi:hypothetical protein